MSYKYVIGVDYGTDSVRCLIVNAANGQEIGSSIFYYRRWKDGLYCNPSLNQFRQHPLDYIEGLEYVMKNSSGGNPSQSSDHKALWPAVQTFRFISETCLPPVSKNGIQSQCSTHE